MKWDKNGCVLHAMENVLCMNREIIEHPKHYVSHPSGIECIQITEHMGFCLGNAMKYLWRAGLKDDVVQDLEKAKWYIEREIIKRTKEKNNV